MYMSTFAVLAVQAGAIESGGQAVDDVTGLFFKIAGAIAAFLFLGWLVKAKAFASAVAAIAMGVLVMYGINLPKDGTANDMLRETVQSWTKGSTTQENQTPTQPRG